MSVYEVQWCDPPERWPGTWMPLLEQVLERPGEWALVRCDFSRAAQAQQAVRDLRKAARGDRRSNGRMPATIPPGRWEFEWRQLQADRPVFGVWARYLGPSIAAVAS